MDFKNKRNILSPRLREIAELLAKGYPPKIIAKDLKISVFTVRNHILNMKLKLNAQSTINAIYIYCDQVEKGLYAKNSSTLP